MFKVERYTMKKIFILFVVIFILATNTTLAKDVDRKIIKNATAEQIQTIILDTLALYDGVITIKEINKKEYKYVVDYNGTTFLGVVGWSKDKKYPKAMFSCQLRQKGDDVEIVSRKVIYSGWFGPQQVFNHYKKIYQELEYLGFIIEEPLR